ncbi:MAG: hypothetical protein HQL14_00885 [Candidatus Omnitrophica bacterium]|nr:hypothetical protein [Candidatus Omnitrophota bacterium]
MEPISLSTAGVILLSMAAGAMLTKLFGKKGSCCSKTSVDENKEKAINDLVAK